MANERLVKKDEHGDFIKDDWSIPKSYRDSNAYITLTELYGHYTHRTYDITSNTRPVPHIPKQEISDHEYALTYKQWKQVIDVYCKHILLRLKKGLHFRIPKQMGTLHFKKVKHQQVIDWDASKKAFESGESKLGEFKYRYPKDMHGYFPIIEWYRKEAKYYNLKNKWLFKADLLRPTWTQYFKELRKDALMILNLNTKY